ncbi:YrhB domain-containing protein [Promicromonospora sp. CA-289599]|uniref:YrhB domain-containing protein n=1 Tax=Promicromonospora sp. CA-289599 TaxID=3240014 RepID=UPI003D92A084
MELEAKSGKRMAIFDGELGVQGTVDHDDVWIVNWNTADYLQSGNVFDQFLAGPIAVPKNGDEFVVLGTAGTTDQELDRWRATDLREVSEAEARQLLAEKFGAPGSELYAPMVVDGGHRPPPT